MSKSSICEFGTFIIVCTGCYLAPLDWPEKVSSGRLVIYLSIVFLMQTLVRDIWIISRQNSVSPGVSRSVFCLESVVGISAVIMGCALLVFSTSKAVPMTKLSWIAAIFCTQISCLALKDFVVGWRPFKIFRDPDHLNILFSWK